MSSSERLFLSAVLAAALAASLGGCATPAGDGPAELRFGESARAMQIGESAAGNAALLAGLAQDFAARTPTVIEFDFGSAALDPVAQTALAQQAAWLLDNRRAAIRLTGHADAVGSAPANRRLGQRRAEAAARYLIAQGVSAERIAAVDSLGEGALLVATEGPERRNRRVVADIAWLGRAPRPVSEMDGVRAQVVFDNYQSLKNAVVRADTEE